MLCMPTVSLQETCKEDGNPLVSASKGTMALRSSAVPTEPTALSWPESWCRLCSGQWQRCPGLGSSPALLISFASFSIVLCIHTSWPNPPSGLCCVGPVGTPGGGSEGRGAWDESGRDPCSSPQAPPLMVWAPHTESLLTLGLETSPLLWGPYMPPTSPQVPKSSVPWTY